MFGAEVKIAPGLRVRTTKSDKMCAYLHGHLATVRELRESCADDHEMLVVVDFDEPAPSQGDYVCHVMHFPLRQFSEYLSAVCGI